MAKQEATLVLKIKQTGAKALKKTKDALVGIGKASLVAGTAIVGFVSAGVAAFRTQELAINSLNQSLVQQGIFTKDLSKKYQDMATSLQKVTTFGDEAIIQSQSQLQSYLGQTEITEDLMKATLDFASAMKVDLKTAADLVGKSVGSSTNALSRYGISVDTSASKSEKLAAITQAMSEKFGGQSEAAAAGLGSIDQLKNSFGDFMELVGERVAPLFVKVAKSLKGMIEDEDQIGVFLDTMTTMFSFVAKSGSFLISTLNAVGGTIGTVLAGAIESVSLLMEGQFARAFDVAQQGAARVSEIFETEKLAHAERVAAIDLALEEKKIVKDAQDKLNLKNTLLRKSDIEKQAKLKEITDQQKHDAKLFGLEQKAGETSAQFQIRINKKKLSAKEESFDRIKSLSGSNNKALAAISKSSALRSIAIDGPVAVTKAFAAFPPPFNFVMAGAVAASVAQQAANVAGVQLAEGGIVPATPGGIQATIGEGGRDEAVIPLDDAGGIGGNVTIIVNGGLLGDESSAREFATAVDQELFKLRQSNESVAFDDGII